MSARITTCKCEASSCTQLTSMHVLALHLFMNVISGKRYVGQSLYAVLHSIWITLPTLDSHFISPNIEMLNKIRTKPNHFEYDTGAYDRSFVLIYRLLNHLNMTVVRIIIFQMPLHRQSQVSDVRMCVIWNNPSVFS